MTEATGGSISYIWDAGKLWRLHTFTGDGTLIVTEGGADVEYLLVAGGGSGSRYTGNGGPSSYIPLTSGGGGGAKDKKQNVGN